MLSSKRNEQTALSNVISKAKSQHTIDKLHAQTRLTIQLPKRQQQTMLPTLNNKPRQQT